MHKECVPILLKLLCVATVRATCTWNLDSQRVETPASLQERKEVEADLMKDGERLSAPRKSGLTARTKHMAASQNSEAIPRQNRARTLRTEAQLVSAALFDKTPELSIDRAHLKPSMARTHPASLSQRNHTTLEQDSLHPL